MELHTIRRFGIDIYRYRKEALALRAQTRTEFFRMRWPRFSPGDSCGHRRVSVHARDRPVGGG